MNNKFEDLLKKINDDDLVTMFNTHFPVSISNRAKELNVESKLDEYSKYEIPVCLGDIIKFQEKTYVVTCIYTDNSVDILSEDANKKNVGLYMKDVEVVGKLEVIQEG